jgi:Domain of unknown function (DUF4271)
MSGILPRYILAISTIFDATKSMRLMKITIWTGLTFLALALFSNASLAQPRIDTLHKNVSDTPRTAAPDSGSPRHDTSHIRVQAILPIARSYNTVVTGILAANRFMNLKEPAIYFIAQKKKLPGKEFVFYTLCAIILILGLFKTFYGSYFNNLFRVFFNTSIRQNQLTDQLLQAKLPSFILNIFFAISTGFYIWLLFKNYHPPRLVNSQVLLPVCVFGIGLLYLVKYCILKFMGWMSGMQQAADNYIFVIFLVNKIIGVVLVPFIVVLAFSSTPWVNYTTLFSLLLIGVFFLSRYIKTYGVLEYRFPLGPLHFVVYILALEIVPLLLIYKVAIDYLV